MTFPESVISRAELEELRVSSNKVSREYDAETRSIEFKESGELLAKELRTLLEDRVWETLKFESGAEWFAYFRPKGWRLAEDEVPEVAALLRYKGESKVKDVAEALDVTPRTVLNQLGKSETYSEIPTRQQKREDAREAICDMPEASNREIAREVGVDHKTVAAVKRDMEAEAAERAEVEERFNAFVDTLPDSPWNTTVVTRIRKTAAGDPSTLKDSQVQVAWDMKAALADGTHTITSAKKALEQAANEARPGYRPDTFHCDGNDGFKESFKLVRDDMKLMLDKGLQPHQLDEVGKWLNATLRRVHQMQEQNSRKEA